MTQLVTIGLKVSIRHNSGNAGVYLPFGCLDFTLPTAKVLMFRLEMLSRETNIKTRNKVH
jgi:hypothetical protein